MINIATSMNSIHSTPRLSLITRTKMSSPRPTARVNRIGLSRFSSRVFMLLSTSPEYLPSIHSQTPLLLKTKTNSIFHRNKLSPVFATNKELKIEAKKIDINTKYRVSAIKYSN